MKKALYSLCALGALVCLVGSASADMLYESTVINTSGGVIPAMYNPANLSGSYMLLDDISVPPGGWIIDTVSTFFQNLVGTPTTTNAYLTVFPKSLGTPNPMDYATNVPVTMARETFTDPNNGFSRNTYRFDASGLNLSLAPGDYWIGLTPIADGTWMAWGSRTPNMDRPIYWRVSTGAYTTYSGLWTGPDMMMRIQGTVVPPICRGDCDCDGSVGFSDIDYFVASIPDQEAAWAALYADRHGGAQPPCTFANCDLDGDGHVGFGDIDLFVTSIPSACP